MKLLTSILEKVRSYLTKSILEPNIEFEYKFVDKLSKELFLKLLDNCQDDYGNPNITITLDITFDDNDLRILTYKTLLEKFNQKYTKLSSSQKNLLREYINNISNTNSLKDTLKEIVKVLKKDLKSNSKHLKDKVVKIKLKESLNSIDNFCGTNNKSKIVKDSHVVQTMRYLELLKELKKSGNKNKKVL